MDKKDGGPALPCETYQGTPVPGGDGMSLRDYFAGQALVGIASLSGGGFGYPEDDAARWAYRYADAMLAEREDG